MPRGSGKTVLSETAAVWAVLYGRCRYVCIIAANKTRAEAMLESIKLSLETNALLGEDFPKIIFPIQRLEHIHNRAQGQTYRGLPTRISWTTGKIILPTIQGSPASGSIISVTGQHGCSRSVGLQRHCSAWRH